MFRVTRILCVTLLSDKAAERCVQPAAMGPKQPVADVLVLTEKACSARVRELIWMPIFRAALHLHAAQPASRQAYDENHFLGAQCPESASFSRGSAEYLAPSPMSCMSSVPITSMPANLMRQACTNTTTNTISIASVTA